MDSTLEDEDSGVCIFETFFTESTDCVPTIFHDSDPVDYANNCCFASEAQDNQDMVPLLIWPLPHCCQLFYAFPEVLFIEGTHKTNTNTFPLFTVGICDENFKMNVILRVFCPNEWSSGYSKRQFLLFLVLMHAKECAPSSPMVIHKKQQNWMRPYQWVSMEVLFDVVADGIFFIRAARTLYSNVM